MLVLPKVQELDLYAFAQNSGWHHTRKAITDQKNPDYLSQMGAKLGAKPLNADR
jgi:hypothetical protein